MNKIIHNVLFAIVFTVSCLGLSYCIAPENTTIVNNYYHEAVPYSAEIVLLHDVTLDGVVYEQLPLGVYNKNPGNIKVGKSKWLGETGENLGFITFETHEHGVRAIAKVLQTYELRHGLNTIDGIIRRYSATEQEKYVQFMCSYLNVQPHEQININDRLPDLVKGIIHFENGIQPYSNEVFLLLGV